MDACGRRIVKASYRAILRRCDNDLKRNGTIVRGDTSRLSDLDSLRHFFAPEQVVQHLSAVCPVTVASLGKDSRIFNSLTSAEGSVRTRIVNAADIKRTVRLIFNSPTLVQHAQSDPDLLVDESPRGIRFVEDYLRALRQHSLFLQWLLLLSRDHSKLEDGAALISAVAQPQRSVNEIHNKVTRTLNDIADTVKVKLGSNTPPLSDNESDEHRNHPDTTQTTLSAVNQVLFEEMGFFGNTQQSCFSLENSQIDRVLHSRSGAPIAISMIYIAICERIGMRISAVNFPYHFMLKWHPSDSEDSSTKCYIDVLNHGQFVSQNDCKVALQKKGVQPKREHFQSVMPPLIYARMLRNIISLASSHPRPADYASVASPEYVYMHMLAAAVPNPSSHYIIEEHQRQPLGAQTQSQSSAQSRV